MHNRTRKNYLRTCRKQIGLDQRQLAHILGLKSSARISAMELGHAVPTVRECVAFNLLFRRPFQDLWPRFNLTIETETLRNTRRLMGRLGRRHVQSARKRARITIIRGNLARIVARLPREALLNP
jgi:DNA-binding XRE family transcriptional regulator